MYSPSKQEFVKLARNANTILVYKEILADLLTPVSAFQKLKTDYSYLLESVEGEEKIARFSFVGIEPSVVFKTKGNSAEVIKKGRAEKFYTESPLTEISRIMSNYKTALIKGMPRFSGGLVGFMGYDVVRFFENIPDKNPDDLNICDSIFMLADSHVIFDHSIHKVKVVVNAYLEKTKNSEADSHAAYEKAVKKIDKLIERLNIPDKRESCISRSDKKKNKYKKHKMASNVTRPQFEDAVLKAKKYISSGDIIQVVLSQRFHTKLMCDPFDVYRALRSLNPSPYMYYLNFDNIKLVGSSPELLVRCEDGVVETRPIAGTRHRTGNEREDKKLEKELLQDIKERAEHVMLVDLGRNDIGRVSRPGTVIVTDFMMVEKFSHVMHIVSNCKGMLDNGKNSYDVLKVCFPAGTVSGAPKVRAMEIIDELENTRRGPYAGAVGYFSFSGNMDTCINIRTILVNNDDAYIQAGAGIVSDSIPSKEYQETINKAKAMIKAIEIAERGLD